MSDQKLNQGLDFLGEKVDYANTYDPSLLQSVPRKPIHGVLRKIAYDQWNAYELSWLSSSGMPMVGVGEFTVDGNSEFLIESKSFKLYLNSLNDHVFSSIDELSLTLQHDLSVAAKGRVDVVIKTPPFNDIPSNFIQDWLCLESMYTSSPALKVTPNVLSIENEKIVNQKVYTHLLKSNCLVTSQPDWGTLFIEYTGYAWDLEKLLEYILSYRHHTGFHEQCVELIFDDITSRLKPKELMVQACYTRRGGLDINPIRSSRPDWKGMSGRGFRQ